MNKMILEFKHLLTRTVSKIRPSVSASVLLFLQYVPRRVIDTSAREHNREGAGREGGGPTDGGKRGSMLLLLLPAAIVILVLLELPTKGHFEVSSFAVGGSRARFRGSSLSIRRQFFAPRLGTRYDRCLYLGVWLRDCVKCCMSRMTPSVVQKQCRRWVSSFYNHANFRTVTEPGRRGI